MSEPKRSAVFRTHEKRRTNEGTKRKYRAVEDVIVHAPSTLILRICYWPYIYINGFFEVYRDD